MNTAVLLNSKKQKTEDSEGISETSEKQSTYSTGHQVIQRRDMIANLCEFNYCDALI